MGETSSFQKEFILMEDIMNGIELRQVNKTLKKNHILKDINLSLTVGKIYGFYGRNGSGKTMLFRCISGLLIPDTGDVTIFDKKLGKDISFPESMGLVMENIGFWPQYTGFENLKLISNIRNMIDDEDIKNVLSLVGLEPADKRKYKQYSLGMKQKLSIAQALMERPNLLILDEPTNSLDEQSVQKFRDIMLEQKDKGTLILIASHNKDDIRLLCDEIFQLDEGECRPMEGNAL